MPATYTLGRDYTVAGLTGATDLEVTRSAERIDVSTRAGAKPIKRTVAGLPDLTFSCTVYAEALTKFVIGKGYAVTLNGTLLGTLVCMDANREEPQEGVVTYKLTLKTGLESATANQVDIGPGEYRGAAA
jgi:hypothetical protein